MLIWKLHEMRGGGCVYGYIRTFAPEMKVREQEYYRAVYCGLCRTMGKCTGQCSRMTLSYDMTFFALVRMALTGEAVTIRPRRCVAHPLRRRLMAEPNDTLRLCAYLSAVLAYHKVRDDRADESGLKKTAATLATPYLRSLRRRARRRGYAEADERIAAAMRALSRLEASRPMSVDEPADLFGELMAALLSAGLSNGCAQLANAIGRHVGRWIYILDAADDFEEDVRRERYNPFACLYRDPNLKTLPRDKRESIRLSLMGDLAGLERAFDLLDPSENPDIAGILSNVLYEGLPRETDRVLGLDDCTCEDGHPSGKSASKRRRKHRASANTTER